MPELLTLTRAARLVGITRGALQKKIKYGELATFEGMIALSELLRAFPEAEAQVADDAMLERVERIKDAAATKVAPTRVVLPQPEVLAARVASLNQELAASRMTLDRHSIFIETLTRKLGELEQLPERELRSGLRAFGVWLAGELQQPPVTRFPSQLLIKDSFLRIMAAQIRVIPSNHEFFVEGNDTILEAALRAGLALNYGCSNGNCGLCKARILSGEVKKVRPHDHVISAAEKTQGYALLCAHTAVTDLVIQASEAAGVHDIPLQQIATRVKKTEPLADDIMLVHLQTPRTKRLRFLAGQHATLQLANGLREVHPIASCPCDDRNLQFHICRSASNPFTDHVFTQLKSTDTVSLEGPKGNFVLREDSPRSLIFVACDAGFAPIKSLIEHAMALDVAERMHLYWLACGRTGHYLHNLCRSWSDALDNFAYTPLVAATPDPASAAGPAPETGAAQETIEQLLARVGDDHPELAEFDVYVAAAEPVANTAEFLFLDRGLPPAQLFIERLH